METIKNLFKNNKGFFIGIVIGAIITFFVMGTQVFYVTAKKDGKTVRFPINQVLGALLQGEQAILNQINTKCGQ
jgi:hypothetical protein